MAAVRIGVVGATGYAGVEIVRLLVRHPNAQITCVTSESRSGVPLSAVFPHLSGYVPEQLRPFSPKETAELADVVFLARGNGWAMKHAAALLRAGVKVIDIAADFRLRDPAVWREYYGCEHEAGDLLAEAVYGLPELYRDQIRKARLVANPGCYPTSAILALAPALKLGLVETRGVIVCSASGVSGAGRSKTEVPYLFSELDSNYRAYGVLKHRHTPEIEQELSVAAGTAVPVTFTPHLVPMTRGIHTTAYASLAAGADPSGLRQAYEEFYRDAPFVHVLLDGQFPETKQAAGSNYCRISPVFDERTGRVIVLSVIDNLVKGAAGQAIQNMNLMFGLDETAGLDFPAMYP